MLSSFVTFVWSVLNLVFRGYLFVTFWAWFVVTSFPTVPALTILPAIGLSYLVAILSPWRGVTQVDLDAHRNATANKGDATILRFVNAGVYTFILLCSWLGAWVVHHFM